jgi:hypothetical protein
MPLVYHFAISLIGVALWKHREYTMVGGVVSNHDHYRCPDNRGISSGDVSHRRICHVKNT